MPLMPDNLSTHVNPVKFVAATVAAAALTMLLSGCARDTSAGGELLRAEAEPRATSRILLAQTVTGAGEDAMLYQHHFDGVELNSLGMAKLRLMLEDDFAAQTRWLTQLTVYARLPHRAEVSRQPREHPSTRPPHPTARLR